MTPSAAVLVCALELLGRSHAMAPIKLLASPPPHASKNVEAFVTRDPDTIYLMTSSQVFRDALGEPWTSARSEACQKIASIIVHEEWHLRHGPDERGAYLAQLTILQALGASSPTITSVRLSMAAAVDATQARDRRAALSGGGWLSARRPGP